jgi:lipopolysaccharide/colanic/teichoic acid biosynthesis glycosyltransferase
MLFMTTAFYPRIGKRLFDLACAAIGIVLLSPLLLLIALAVKLTSHGPVFFRQVRVGQFGRPFAIIKFRTMKHGDSTETSLLTAAGDSRVTKAGKWLRKAKLDELPQLINVMFGEMSLVGPRPEVPVYVATYSERQRAVLAAKPGITCLSTHHFANEEDLLNSRADKDRYYIESILPVKLEMDLMYCADISFWGDLKLIFATLAGIVVRTGQPRKPLRVPDELN